jgi:hypothetical protein
VYSKVSKYSWSRMKVKERSSFVALFYLISFKMQGTYYYILLSSPSSKVLFTLRGRLRRDREERKKEREK